MKDEGATISTALKVLVDSVGTASAAAGKAADPKAGRGRTDRWRRRERRCREGRRSRALERCRGGLLRRRRGSSLASPFLFLLLPCRSCVLLLHVHPLFLIFVRLSHRFNPQAESLGRLLIVLLITDETSSLLVSDPGKSRIGLLRREDGVDDPTEASKSLQCDEAHLVVAVVRTSSPHLDGLFFEPGSAETLLEGRLQGRDDPAPESRGLASHVESLVR